MDPDSGSEIGVPESGRSAAGELWYKGPNVMAGYLGNDRRPRKPLIHKDFCTPETWPVDADGCVHIVDRLNERFLTWGV